MTRRARLFKTLPRKIGARFIGTRPAVHLFTFRPKFSRWLFTFISKKVLTRYSAFGTAIGIILSLLWQFPLNSHSWVTRQELAQEMARILNIFSPILCDQSISREVSLQQFSDVSKALQNSLLPITQNVMQGFPDNTFRPASKVNLGEGICHWARFIRFLQKNMRYPPNLISHPAKIDFVPSSHWLYEDIELLRKFGAMNEHYFAKQDFEKDLTTSDFRKMSEATILYFGQDNAVFWKTEDGVNVAFKGTLHSLSADNWEYEIPGNNGKKVLLDGFISLTGVALPCMLNLSHPRYADAKILIPANPDWFFIEPLRKRFVWPNSSPRYPHEKLIEPPLLKERLNRIFQKIRDKSHQQNTSGETVKSAQTANCAKSLGANSANSPREALQDEMHPLDNASHLFNRREKKFDDNSELVTSSLLVKPGVSCSTSVSLPVIEADRPEIETTKISVEPQEQWNPINRITELKRRLNGNFQKIAMRQKDLKGKTCLLKQSPARNSTSNYERGPAPPFDLRSEFADLPSTSLRTGNPCGRSPHDLQNTSQIPAQKIQFPKRSSLSSTIAPLDDSAPLMKNSLKMLTSSCGLNKEVYSGTKVRVEGKVLNALSKKPLSNVQVLVDKHLCQTNPLGIFTFPKLKDNQIVEILVASPGFESLSMKYKAGFKKGPLNIFLNPYKSWLKARIISSKTGEPLKNGIFSINTSNFTTDSQGTISIKGLKPGYYKANFSAPGYSQKSELLFVEEKGSNRTIKLQPLGG